MLPEVTQLQIDQPQETITDPGKSLAFDFSSGEFLLTDGKLVAVEDIEALKVWIEKVLRTEKYRFKIYEKTDGAEEYGVSIEDLVVGQNYPQSFLESELKREINTAILKHPRIQSLSSWSIVKDNPLLTISFTVNLVDGSTISQEVSF